MPPELPNSAAAPVATPSPVLPASSGAPLGSDAAHASDGAAGESATLADHEAEFAPGAAERAAREDAAPRDEGGRFKRGERHRAASQVAAPDDVETINRLTARIKAADAAAGADIKQQAGESNRVFELRRRAELAERRANGNGAVQPASPSTLASPPAASVAEPAAQSPAAAARPAAVSSPTDDPEPKEDDFTDFTKYIDARARWSARQEHRELQARDRQVAFNGRRLEAARKAYPDFDAVAFTEKTPINPDGLIRAWIDEDDDGMHVWYHLHKNPAEARRLNALAPFQQAKELALLGQRLTKAAVPPAEVVGSVAAPVAQTVTRPPNPTRTGPMRAADKPPGDESTSISDHEKYYAPRAN